MPSDLSKIYKKIGATRANINFLTRCRKYKLTPKGFISNSRINFNGQVGTNGTTVLSYQNERNAKFIARKTISP